MRTLVDKNSRVKGAEAGAVQDLLGPLRMPLGIEAVMPAGELMDPGHWRDEGNQVRSDGRCSNHGGAGVSLSQLKYQVAQGNDSQ